MFNRCFNKLTLARNKIINICTRQTVDIKVFVSSPSDCQFERQKIREIITRLNSTPSVISSNLNFTGLFWEDLPPGEGKPNDLQHRINDVMKRYGLKRYHIYVGIMRDRLGTPTAKTVSGTVEEFESALDTKKRSGHPSEILFYFIEPQSPISESPEVKKFRLSLDTQGFLYSRISEEAFEEHIERHLLVIASEWFQIKQRIRRSIKVLRPVVMVLSAMIIMGGGVLYWQFDRGGYDKVLQDADAVSQSELLNRWTELSPYMFFHENSARVGINVLLTKKLGEEDNLLQVLPLWSQWSRHGLSKQSSEFESATQQLSHRIVYQFNASLKTIDIDNSVELWLNTLKVKLPMGTSTKTYDTLSSLLIKQWFILFHTENKKYIDWYGMSEGGRQAWISHELIEEERVVLDSLINTVNQIPEPENSSLSLKVMLSIAQLTQDFELAEKLVTAEILIENRSQFPALEFFIRYAPEQQLITWLQKEPFNSRNLDRSRSSIEEYIVRSKRSPELVLAYLDQLVLAEIEADFIEQAYGNALFYPFDDAQPTIKNELKKRVFLWIKSKQSPPLKYIELASEILVDEHLNNEEKAVLVDFFIQQESNDAISGYSSIYVLSKLNTTDAWNHIWKRLNEHLNDKIYYGFSEKATLLKAFSLKDIKDSDLIGKPLVERALRDIDEHENMSLVNASDIIAAYFITISQKGMGRLEQHKTWIERVIEARLKSRRRAQYTITLLGTGGLGGFDENILDATIDTQLGAIFGKLGDDDMIQWLHLPEIGHPVIENNFKPRFEYLIGLSSGKWSDSLSERIVVTITGFELYSVDVLYSAAQHLTEEWRRWLAKQLAEKSASIYIDFLNFEENQDLLYELGSQTSSLDLIEGLLSRCTDRNNLKQTMLCSRLLERWMELDGDPVKILPVALALNLSFLKLIDSSIEVLNSGKLSAQFGAAFAYLLNHGTASQILVFDSVETQDLIRQFWMQSDSAELLFWMQRVHFQKAVRIPEILLELVVARHIFWGGDSGEFEFMFAGNGLFSPFIENLLEVDPNIANKIIIKLLQEPAKTFELQGNIVNSDRAIKAYLFWSYGRGLKNGALIDISSQFMIEMLNRYSRSKNAAELRAASLVAAGLSR